MAILKKINFYNYKIIGDSAILSITNYNNLLTYESHNNIMKILYVLPYPKFFSQHKRVGGHIAHCIGILKAFKNKNYNIRFFSEEDDTLLNNLDIEIKTHKNNFKSFLGRQFWILSFIKELKKQVEDYNPDIIYMRYSTSFCFWYYFIDKAIGDTKIIIEINSLGSQRIKSLSFFERKFLQTASSTFAISPLLKNFISNNIGLTTNVITNGIDKDRIPGKLIKFDNNMQNNFKIVYAGLLKPKYGLEFIIKTTDDIRKEIPEVELVIYGDGPLLPILEKLIINRKWVRLAGPVDFNLIPEKLVSADLLLYPTSSFNQFGSPTKLLEYMAAARPIVAAKTQQTSTILKNGKLGYLFSLDNMDELKQAVIKVYSDRDNANKMALQARKEALEKHSWDSRLDMILNTLQ